MQHDHQHSDVAYDLLADYCIGVLATTQTPPETTQQQEKKPFIDVKKPMNRSSTATSQNASTSTKSTSQDTLKTLPQSSHSHTSKYSQRLPGTACLYSGHQSSCTASLSVSSKTLQTLYSLYLLQVSFYGRWLNTRFIALCSISITCCLTTGSHSPRISSYTVFTISSQWTG